MKGDNLISRYPVRWYTLYYQHTWSKEYDKIFAFHLNDSKNYNNYVRQNYSIIRKNNIFTLVSFTAQKENYQQFPYVRKICRKIKVNRVWTDRFIPIGNGKEYNTQTLTQQDTKHFYTIIKKKLFPNFVFTYSFVIVINY